MRNKYIYLFSCCFLVKGKSQSIICDVQRRNYEVIPNSLYEILQNLDSERELEKIKKRYIGEDLEIFDSYIDFLLKEEFIFIDDSLHNRFPKIEIKFDLPCLISNSIIELNNNSNLNLIEKVIEQLDILRCESVEIRFYEDSFNNFKDIVLPFFSDTGIRSLRLLFNIDEIENDFFKNLGDKYNRIREVYIYSNKLLKSIESPFFPIIQIKNKLILLNCGSVSEFYFSPDLKCFMEANLNNSCLHKKISIDVDGNIKNCPSMQQSFGNIENTTLKEALQHEDFKKYWNLTKDNIEVCKDCEFRYICTDCRAYTERSHTDKNGLDISKPLKCGYNPYIGEWEEWSTNPLKQKAIQFYGMQALIKK